MLHCIAKRGKKNNYSQTSIRKTSEHLLQLSDFPVRQGQTLPASLTYTGALTCMHTGT